MKLGIAVLNYDDCGAFGAGALYAWREAGLKIDFIGACANTCAGCILFNNGIDAQTCCEICGGIARGEDYKPEAFRKHFTHERAVLAVCGENKILGTDEALKNTFGCSFEPLSAEKVIRGEYAPPLCRAREKIFWIMSTLGANRLLSIENEAPRVDGGFGKAPAYTLSVPEALSADFSVNFQAGYAAAESEYDEALRQIYFG